MSRAAAIKKFDDILIELFDGIENILRFQSIEITSFMKLYTIIFNYCTGSVLLEWTLHATAFGRQKYLLTPGGNSNGDRCCGGGLYYRLENYLIDYFKNLYQMSKNMSDEDLLRFYIDQWNKYQNSSKFLPGIFHYLDRHWVRTARQGFTSIYEVSTLLMLMWHEFFLKPIVNRLTSICLKIIDNERNTHVLINTQLIKDVIDSYRTFNFDNDMPVWFYEEPTTIPAGNIYEEWFEVPFLKNTKLFYQIKANKERHESLLEYLTEVSRNLNEEEHRVQSYIRISSTQSFLTMIEKILIHDHLNDICEEVRRMLNGKNYQDLKCLFQPMKKLLVTKKQLKIVVQDYIYQVGYQLMEDISMKAIRDPKIYVKTILEIYEKFSELIQDIFLNDLVFLESFNQACAKLVNNNPVTRTAGSTTKSSELLARYCDVLLRKGNKAVEETDIEEEFNQIMIVFNYIDDKDVFLKFYGKMLAKRLVGQLSASDDYEESMISKLKQACGFEYASKLQRMFQDISVGKTLIMEYGQYCENQQVTGIVDFSAMVLSSNSWPFSAPTNFVLPIELKSTFDSFTDFYTRRHNGRKLTWLHQHSKGELQTFFTSQKYILQVSIYQMVVLLLFNKVLNWTVEQIQDETQIKSELLIQILFGLLKTKVLVCTNINENEDFKETDIKTNYSIQLSMDFRSKKLRINLNVPLQFIEQKESDDVHRTINEDRKMIIQAVIIRIMKARQTLKHNSLMQEVIQQLQSRFKPEIPTIKKCIDLLIDKEYLQRDSNDKDILHYLA